MSFKLDTVSTASKEYTRKYAQIFADANNLEIKTDSRDDLLIDINNTNFSADNASFANGTVIVGVPDADHAVFGASDGTRSVTTTSNYFLTKGSYISFSSVCGVALGGSIELPEDPDADEDLVVEISVDEENFVRLVGRVTETNSLTTAYVEHRFCMTSESDNYYIRITQTDHSGDGFDYYAFKDLKYNILAVSLYDPVNKINVFF